jgi:hypothetical protein
MKKNELQPVVKDYLLSRSFRVEDVTHFPRAGQHTIDESKWDGKLNELKQFYVRESMILSCHISLYSRFNLLQEQNGHFKVPYGKKPSKLYWWLRSQKGAFLDQKQGGGLYQLPGDRVHKLEDSTDSVVIVFHLST